MITEEHMDKVIALLTEEILRLRAEIRDWKDRYESLLADAQASEAAFDKAMNEGP